MQQIAFAWQRFFEQFVPYAFSEGDLIQDPDNVLYPRITYSYAVGDFFVNTLTTMQIWDWGHNSARLFEVCDRIAEAIPVESGTSIIIPGEIYHEYRNPITGVWTRFEVADFQSIADQFAPIPIEWRRVESESAGGIEMWRGSPFLTPSPKDEAMSRVMYGTLQARYLTTV